MATNPYKWYYHSSAKNETAKALAAALENNCGLLLFIGKPGCAICETAWSKSYNGTAMMDGAGKMAEYLKANHLVGLKIDDSQAHFSNLAAGAMGHRNPDGTATNTNAPFLVLIKVKAGKEAITECRLSGKNSIVDTFFGGYGSLRVLDKTYAKIAAWLDKLLGSGKYQTAFQAKKSAAANPVVPPAATPLGKFRVTVNLTAQIECVCLAENAKRAKEEIAKYDFNQVVGDGWDVVSVSGTVKSATAIK